MSKEVGHERWEVIWIDVRTFPPRTTEGAGGKGMMGQRRHTNTLRGDARSLSANVHSAPLSTAACSKDLGCLRVEEDFHYNEEISRHMYSLGG